MKRPAVFQRQPAGPARPRRQRGFSLIEVMISSSLLLIAMTGALMSYSAMTKVLEHQRHLTRASSIAESEMEDLLLRDASHADLAWGAHPAKYFDREGGAVGFPSIYTVVWSVAPLGIASMKRITLTLSWSEGVNAETKSIVLVTDRT
jgi:prepilin-type N-terminal cleavage/methylation domain-containing protein